MPIKFLLRRIILAAPTLAGVAVIVFVLMRVVPGDPIAMMVGPTATADDIQKLRHVYGLDESIPMQFVRWAAEVLHGNLGVSINLKQSVLPLILSRLPATLELAGLSMLIAAIGGAVIAVAGVYWSGRWPEAVIDALSNAGQAIPDFLWGILGILILGVLVPVLPISGRIDPRIEVEFSTGFYLLESLLRGKLDIAGNLFLHMILPAAALALPVMAIVTRILKNSLAAAMQQDYVLLARIKGMPRLTVILTEALRNALVPAVTLSGVQFTFLLGNTVLIETIFGYPGIGSMSIGAVTGRDFPLVQGLILTYAVLSIMINLSVDMSYALLDPRLRHE